MSNPINKDLQPILAWMTLDYNPDKFISVQIPFQAKTTSLEGFENSLRKIAKWVEKDLIGDHWINKHYRFAGFYEHGRDGTWHAHILFNCPDRTINEISAAFAVAGQKYKTTHRTDKVPDVDVREIFNTEGLMCYCTKQLGAGRLRRIRTERIFTSETLFNRRSNRQRKRLTL